MTGIRIPRRNDEAAYRNLESQAAASTAHGHGPGAAALAPRPEATPARNRSRDSVPTLRGFDLQDQGPRPLNLLEKEREAKADIAVKVDPEVKKMSEYCPVFTDDRKDVFTKKGYRVKLNKKGEWSSLSKGTFGTVYKSKKGDKFYAIKEQKYKAFNKDEGVSMNMSIRDAEHIKMLKGHENVIQLIDIFAIDPKGKGGKLYMILEFADSGDLYDYMAKYPHNRIPYQEARRLFRAIAQGVNFMHGRRIAHLDIKLNNILLCKSKEDPKQVIPKITDFGLSLVAWTPDHGIILTNSWPGTFEYLAPEALYNYYKRPAQKYLHSSIEMARPGVDGAPEDMGPVKPTKTPIEFHPRLMTEHHNLLPLDVWALGCVLYVMITGNYPFRTDYNGLSLILRGKFIRYHMIPQDCAEFLKTMLTPLPPKRATIRCVLDHDWLKEGRSVQLYIPKQKPLKPAIPRNRTRSDPTADREKGQMAKAMGTYFDEKGGIVEPGHKETTVPSSWTKAMLEGWKADAAELQATEETKRPPSPVGASVADSSPLIEEGKKVLAEASKMTEEERQKVIKDYEAKHGPYKEDPVAQAALEKELMDIPKPPAEKPTAEKTPSPAAKTPSKKPSAEKKPSK